MTKVLNVAEKPAVAKEIARHLSGSPTPHGRPGISKYNYVYEFPYTIRGQQVTMVVTSVTGHLMEIDFPAPYNKNWHAVDPEELFDLDIEKIVPEKNQDIKRTLEREMRSCNWLVLWLDCDREGENIAYEVIDVCRGARQNFKISRARFADVNKVSIERAIQNLEEPNEADSLAVDARQELDLRLGAIFTRFQSLQLQNRFPDLKEKLLSYGPCQFPTLGFVVDRFWRVKSFVPEPFWYISCTVTKGEDVCSLTWSRVRLFDENICSILFETLTENALATVIALQTKPTSKWRPFPLCTVELQKKAAKSLRISAQNTMTIAEKLYQKGFLSYPRTETESFPEGTDLPALLQLQTTHPRWGPYAKGLQNGGFRPPKKGRGDDKSHPPIHPTKSGDDLTGDEARVYEFVARHFLACCSEDAKGMETTATFQIAQETFTATGVMILERNFLEVYPYIKWEAKFIPKFTQGEKIMPTELQLLKGSTTAPNYLTEEELVGLMDKHGIGTDATIAEHIHKVQERDYIFEQDRELKPTTLGEALVAGYNAIQLQVLAKPELRAQTEADVKLIAERRKPKDVMLRENVEAYRQIYQRMVANAGTLTRALARYFQQGPQQNFGGGGRGGGDGGGGGGGGGGPGPGAYVLKCPECSVNMALKAKNDNTGFFIACAGYPGCRKALWLPREIKEINVSSTTCATCSAKYPRCGDIKALDVTMDRNAIAPGMPSKWTTCIGGCDEGFVEYLRNSDKNYGARWFAKGSLPPPPPTTSTAFTSRGLSKSKGGPSFTNSTPQSATISTSRDGSITPQSRGQIGTNQSKYPIAQQYAQLRNLANDDLDEADDGMDQGGTDDGALNGVPNCQCGIAAVKLTVRRTGNNQGREFYKCGNGDVCKFWQWLDEMQGGSSGGIGGGSNYNNDAGDRGGNRGGFTRKRGGGKRRGGARKPGGRAPKKPRK